MKHEDRESKDERYEFQALGTAVPGVMLDALL